MPSIAHAHAPNPPVAPGTASSTTAGPAASFPGPAARRRGGGHLATAVMLVCLAAGAAAQDAPVPPPGRVEAAAGNAMPLADGRPGPAAPGSSAPLSGTDPAGAADGPVAIDEGFEQVNVFGGGIFANGWIRQNGSDQPQMYWYQNLSASEGGRWNAFDGPGHSAAVTDFRRTRTRGGTISDWIVTPLVNFGSGSTLKFHTRTAPASTYPDRMQVRVCTSGPCTRVGAHAEDTGDFTGLLLDINPGEIPGGYPDDWRGYTLGVAEGLPQSGSGRVAFRYYVHDSGEQGTRGNLIGLDRVVVTSGRDATSALDFAVTVAPADAAAPDACGTATSIDVTVGDQVNVCYTVANQSTDTLDYHYLRDDRTGPLLTEQPVTLPPGATHRYNRNVTIGGSQAPSATWTAQASPRGYTHATSPVSNFVDISGDGTPIPLQYYPVSQPFPADFDFLLFGERIHRFCVMPAGVFQSEQGACTSLNWAFGVVPVPADTFIFTPSILPFWTYVDVPLGGRLYYKITGAAPNRQFIVQWTDLPLTVEGAGTPTFQLVLHETSHVIEYRYGSESDTASVAARVSIGLQNQWLGNAYPLDVPSGGLAGIGRIVWTPADPAAHVATRQVTINAGTPRLVLDHATLAATAPSHGSATARLTVANPGDGRLDWSVQSAAAANHVPARPRSVQPLGPPGRTSLGRPPFAPRPAAEGAPAAAALPLGLDRFLYAVELWGAYLVRFHPELPGFSGPSAGASIVGTLDPARFLVGATFLDDDFGKLYVFDASSHQLLWYDPSSPLLAEQVVGTAALPIDQTATGLKQDPSSGAVYLSLADGHSRSSLWTIDPATAVTRPVGSTTDAPALVDIAFDAQGNLYGVDTALDALIAIDKTTGSARPVGSLGFDANYASGLAFDYATGTLYFASIDEATQTTGLWTIDTLTGQATLVSPVGPIDGVIQYDALAAARPAGHPCSDPAEVPWLALDTGGGTIPPGGAPATVGLVFDASTLADGVYSAQLCLYSNDPLRRHQGLPVRFTVGDGADAIFADGFDGTTR